MKKEELLSAERKEKRRIDMEKRAILSAEGKENRRIDMEKEQFYPPK